MGNIITSTKPEIPSRDSIGYKNLQEKLKQLKEELIEQKYEILQISEIVESADI